VFLGEPRSEQLELAREAPFTMRLPQYALASLCVLVGLFPQVPIRVLARATSILSGAIPAASLQLPVALLDPSFSQLSAISCAMVAFAGLLSVFLGRTWRASKPQNPTWDCGYAAPSVRMQYSASSIADDLVGMFSTLLRPKVHQPNLTGPFPKPARFQSHVPEVVLELLVLPTLRGIVRAAELLRFIQRGTVHLYLFYMLLTLIVMLAVWR
jgi:hydrogenase-4 component B